MSRQLQEYIDPVVKEIISPKSLKGLPELEKYFDDEAGEYTLQLLLGELRLNLNYQQQKILKRSICDTLVLANLIEAKRLLSNK
jgi:hypothetical protein